MYRPASRLVTLIILRSRLKFVADAIVVLPLCFQVMCGVGIPTTKHVSDKFCPSISETIGRSCVETIAAGTAKAT